jgi:deazaflavin-dependent oxidoreductase (nitroreductase family)
MSRYADAWRRLGRHRWFATVGSRVGPPVDRTLYRATGGWLTATGHSVFPTLLLETTGRRTGRRRTVPLFYVECEGSTAVVATNWGRPRHPQWSANLLADPAARITIGRNRTAVRARLVSGDEFDRLWNCFVELWPAYEDYRERAGREIRLFVLDSSSAGV